MLAVVRSTKSRAENPTKLHGGFVTAIGTRAHFHASTPTKSAGRIFVSSSGFTAGPPALGGARKSYDRALQMGFGHPDGCGDLPYEVLLLFGDSTV